MHTTEQHLPSHSKGTGQSGRLASGKEGLKSRMSMDRFRKRKSGKQRGHSEWMSPRSTRRSSRLQRQLSKLTPWLVILAALYLWFDQRVEKTPPVPETGSLRLLSVSDGDSVRLQLPGYDQTKFRLSAVDAPELDQPYGEEARRCFKNILRSGELSAQVVKTDQYGRLVVNLFVDGDRVDVQLVQQGCAWWYQRYAPNSNLLKRAQNSARESKKGLWKNTGAIEPESWRRGKR
ncbi:MAG: thermonuclease family protein [Pseudomonadota bacterium]